MRFKQLCMCFSKINIPNLAKLGDISADGSQIAYTPITSWDPEWRNYRGGQAMPIWIVDLETLELQTTEKKYCKITSFHGTRAFAQRQKM